MSRIRRFFALLSAVLLTGGVGYAVEPLLRTDFTATAWQTLPHDQAEATPTGARLAGYPDRMGSIRWENLTLPVPVKIEFKIRRVADPGAGHNLGLSLTDSSGDDILVYYNGQTMAYYIRHKGEIIVHEGLGSPVPFPPGGAFTTVTLLVTKDAIEVNTDGVYQGQFDCRLNTLTRLQLHAYMVDVEAESLTVTVLPPRAEVSPVSHDPILSAGFDDTAAATTASGGTLDPQSTGTLRYTDGLDGRAVILDRESRLEYALPQPLTPQGSVSFWMRPEWDGKIADPENFPSYALLTGHDAGGKDLLQLFVWHYLRCDFARLEGGDDIELQLQCRDAFRRGDWVHVALVWQDGKDSKLFFNGVPYWGGKAGVHRINRMAVAAVRSLFLGTPDPGVGRNNPDAAIDRFQLYQAPLSDREIYAQYRRFMPWDVIADRSALPSGQPNAVGVRIARGGAWTQPAPEPELTPTPEARITLTFRAGDGRTIAQQSFDWAADREGTPTLELPALSAGSYRLEAEFATGPTRIARSFPMHVYDVAAPAPESTAEVQLGAPVWERRFDSADGVASSGDTELVRSERGDYLQTGEKKTDRFAVEFTVPAEYLTGEPVMLEIAWPDDRPRSMGFYVYPESTTRHHRDRLEGGVQSGEEYPLTGAIQTTRYLFYPQKSRNLFEVRTLVDGMPGALYSLTVRPLAERLPKLALHTPPGLPARELGNLDEDQSFDILMEFDDPVQRQDWNRTTRIMDRLLDYFDYTGQTVMNYPVIRYGFFLYPVTTGATQGGLFPYEESGIGQVIEMLHRRGKRFMATINFFTLPELAFDPALIQPAIEQGIILKDRNDRPLRCFGTNYRINPIHLEGQRLALAHLRRMLDSYARLDGFAGVDIWIQGLFGCFLSLDEGYDDYTVNEFTRTTGIAVPATDPYERQKFLTGDEHREAWLQFRADRITAFYRQVRALLDEYNPELTLQLSLDGVPTIGSSSETATQDTAEWFRREYGLDFAGLQALPNTRLAPLRHPTSYRWSRHWGNPPSNTNDYITSPEMIQAFGMAGYSGTYYTYFESFNDSLLPKTYQSYFQNADPKPFGRYFLKEFALPLGYGDAIRIQGGAQPFGSAGRDGEIREFARAYRALPALPFSPAPGAMDPVAVRYRATPNGTYWYAVNLLPFDQTVTVAWARPVAATELSTRESLPQAQEITVKLRPFELRSFLLAGQNDTVTAVSVTPDAKVAEYYGSRIQPVREALARLEEQNLVDPATAVLVGRLEAAAAFGRYAEADRLLFSRPVQALIQTAANLENVKEQTQMRQDNHYALNAGATTFYRAANGVLFAPDQAYTPENGAGYVGHRLTTQRQPAPEIPDAELYRTEAYEIDGYRFDVADGVYTVRIWAKVGFEPSAKPDVFVMDITIGGRAVAKNLDLFAAHGNDFRQGAVLEFRDIAVSGGHLDIEFRTDRDASTKLCNAIEVAPQKTTEQPAFEDPPFVPPVQREVEPGAANAYKILCVGNSITRHGIVADPLKWFHESGMAASSEATDFVHLLAAKIQAELPDRPVELYFSNVNEYLALEGGSTDPLHLGGRQLPPPDLVVIQTGEHEGPERGRAESERIYEERVIRPFTGLNPRPAIIAAGIWYPTDGTPYTGWVRDIDDAYRAACNRNGVAYASVERYATDPACRGYGEHPGVKWHPNDAGMAGYATELYQAWRTLPPVR